jgi:2-keto-4-pentenoate hydratase/2-oxohepta-3-ene-1,7-dioic acid hydratase in catechol pathway
MRLASFGDDRIGVIVDDQIFDVTPVLGSAASGLSPMRRLIQRFDELAPALSDLSPYAAQPLAEVSLRTPVSDPSKIVAAPVNYRDHMVEMSQQAHIGALGVFLKAPSSVLDPGGTIQLPYDDRRFDHEGELAFVIGRPARDVAPADALDYVFAYTALLDITMRGGEDRSTRKSFDTFTPIGPWLVTSDEFGDPRAADLRCLVNDQVRQQENTAQLIWGVAELLAYASSVMTLLPGDVLTTGTPAGVGPIVAGDRVDVEISRIGRLSVAVAADRAVHSPTSGANTGPVPPPPPELADTGAGRKSP